MLQGEWVQVGSVTSAGEATLTERESIAYDLRRTQKECWIDVLSNIANCGNTGDPPNRIYVHAIPYFGDSRPEALNRRKKWVDFVKLKRAQWQDTKYSVVCSEPFKRDDYIHWYPKLPGLDKTPVPKLRRDKLGIVVFPTVQSNKASETPLRSRTKRKV